MYEINGQQYSLEDLNEIAKIKNYSLEELLSKNPSIKKIEDTLGKLTSQGQGAPVAETVAPDQISTESTLEDGSLESQKQNELIREGVTESIAQAFGGPKSLVSTAAQWTSFFARTGAGVIDAVERLGAFADPGKAPILAAAIANKDNETIQQAALATTGGLDLNSVYEFADSLDV